MAIWRGALSPSLLSTDKVGIFFNKEILALKTKVSLEILGEVSWSAILSQLLAVILKALIVCGFAG